MEKENQDWWEHLNRIWPWLLIIFLFVLILRAGLGYASPHFIECRNLVTGDLALQGKEIHPQARGPHLGLPVAIFGLAHRWGGYITGRGFSAFFGILSIGLFFLFARSLTGDTESAVFSAVILTISGPHIFLSKFASPVAMAMPLFAGFLYVSSLCAPKKQPRMASFALAGLLLGLSILCNYSLVMFLIPAVILMFLADFKGGAVFSGSSILLVLGMTALEGWFPGFAPGIRDPDFLSALYNIAIFLAPVATLGIIAVMTVIQKDTSRKILFLSLILSGLMPVMAHLISPRKDMVFLEAPFALMILIPPAGILLADLIRREHRYYRYLAVTILTVLLTFGVFHTRYLEDSFPNTDRVVNHIFLKVNKNSRIISEDPYLYRLQFFHRIPLENLDNLSGTSPEGIEKSSEAQIIEKITEGYYDMLLLNGYHHPRITGKLRQEDILSRHYRLSHTEDYHLTGALGATRDGQYQVWLKKDN